MSDHCRSCNAEIRWLYTPKGKLQPIDAKPEKRVILWPWPVEASIDPTLPAVDQGPGGLPVIGGGFNEDTFAIVVDTFTSHFATCPNADAHRKPRERVAK